jgi:hypothetical protein
MNKNFELLYIKKDFNDNDQYLTTMLNRNNHTNIYDDNEYHLYKDDVKKCDDTDYLVYSFDSTLIYDTETFINNKHIFTFDNTLKLILNRVSDVISDFFIRFKFKFKPTDDDFENALKIISMVKIEYRVGGSTLFRIPLFFNILISKMLGKEIKLFDAKTFLSNISSDDHKELCYKFVHDYLVCTTKYYFDDDNGYYLDIPLLDDFYLSKNGANVCATMYHNTEVILHIDNFVDKQLFYYFEEKIYYGFERMEYHHTNSKTKKGVQMNGNEYAVLLPRIHNFITNSLDCGTEINISNYGRYKFIFISLTHINNILPLILEIEITCKNGQTFNLPIDNIEMYEYNDSIIYGTTIDTNYCMKDWLNCQNEYDDLYTMYNKSISTSDYNFNSNYNDTDKIKAIYISNIKIILSDHSENICVDIIVLEQNVFRTKCGMAGVGYCA